MAEASILVTLRLSARDRALLERLVAHESAELEPRGVEVSLSSVMRQLIRAAAAERGVDIAGDARSSTARATRSPEAVALAPSSPTGKTSAAGKAPTQHQVRMLLRKKMGESRGLGARIARELGVDRAQVTRFKAGKEAFPASKLAALYDLLERG